MLYADDLPLALMFEEDVPLARLMPRAYARRGFCG